MRPPSEPILRTERLSVGYPGPRARSVATNLDLTLQRGRLICVLGPNGSGKTTLLRTLAGLLAPLDGAVYYGDQPVGSMALAGLARRRSVVLTRHAGLGPLRVRETVAMGRLPYTDWFGRLTDRDYHSVQLAMQTAGCIELADRRMSELSDGERQRAFIARAIAQETSCMLLDEPTAYLDLPRRVEIVRLLVRLAHQCERAVAMSTHDLDLALQTADEIWLISREGQIYVGLPEELVLDGSFAEVFASEGVRFDSHAGRFVWSAADGRTASIQGEGLLANWTARALERIGLRIAKQNESASLSVEVRDGPVWRLCEVEGTGEFRSLSELVEAIRALPANCTHVQPKMG